MLYRAVFQRLAKFNICKRHHGKIRSFNGDSTSEHLMGQKITRDHEVRTKDSYRQDVNFQVKVTRIDSLSPHVKGLTLKVLADDVPKFFKAGQWIDMIIPGVEVVGGFSICSSPYEFKNDRTVQIAVKQSDHPPAYWIHNKCTVNSEVTIRFGGDFFYDPKDGETEDLLLIAGGVGINPIYSILKHRRDLIERASAAPSYIVPTTTILYSARTLKELIFKENIQNLCNELENSTAKFFVTQNAENDEKMTPDQPSDLSYERISKNYLGEILRKEDRDNSNLSCYICGPPNFIDTMETNLLYCGLLKENIKFEKWW